MIGGAGIVCFKNMNDNLMKHYRKLPKKIRNKKSVKIMMTIYFIALLVLLGVVIYGIIDLIFGG